MNLMILRVKLELTLYEESVLDFIFIKKDDNIFIMNKSVYFNKLHLDYFKIY